MSGLSYWYSHLAVIEVKWLILSLADVTYLYEFSRGILNGYSDYDVVDL